MIDAALGLLQQAMGSPWVYVVLFVLAALDGFFPMIPGETALVTVAVFAASGEPTLLVIILAGAAGAFVGDHVSYGIGLGALGRSHARIRRGRTAYDWARTMLTQRGGQVLVASRYVPGVRTATTITMGGVRYPLRAFSLWDTLAASFWATGWSLVGYLGGAAVGNDPLKGLALGLGLAFGLVLLSEAARRALRSRWGHGVHNVIQRQKVVSRTRFSEERGTTTPRPARHGGQHQCLESRTDRDDHM